MFVSKIITAKLEPKCEHCNGVILLKYQYIKNCGVYEGDFFFFFFSFKCHIFCESIRSKVVTLLKLKYGLDPDELQELPYEIAEHLEMTEMMEIAEKYNDYASGVGGILVGIPEANPEGSIGGTKDAVTSQPLSSAAQVHPLVGQGLNTEKSR